LTTKVQEKKTLSRNWAAFCCAD